MPKKKVELPECEAALGALAELMTQLTLGSEMTESEKELFSAHAALIRAVGVVLGSAALDKESAGVLLEAVLLNGRAVMNASMERDLSRAVSKN